MDAALERRLLAIEARLDALDRRLPSAADVPGAAAATARGEAIRPSASTRDPKRSRPPLQLEELFGGRLLGWLGGVAVALGVAFFVATAIDRGWIDEPTRVLLAVLGSTALLALGFWLHERRGRTQASLAAVAAALAGLYASLTAATALYALVSTALGLALAGLIGIVATAIAVRWSSTVVAGVGLLGALAAPVLVQAHASGRAVLFMAVALIATVGVLIWRRWSWLAQLAYVVSAPQLLVWVEANRHVQLALVVVVLACFWALYVVAAIGYELRVPTERLRIASALLLFSNLVVTAGAGYWVLAPHQDVAARAWLLSLAAVHVGLGVAVPRRRMSAEIGALLIALGLALSAIGLALVLSGPVLVSGWAVEAVVLAWLGRRLGDERANVASALFLAAAVAHALAFEAPLGALGEGVENFRRAVSALAVLAGGCFLSARLGTWSLAAGRQVLEGVAAGLVVYLGSIAIVDLTGPGQRGQLLLSAFWSLTGVLALVLGLARDERRLRLGGLGLLGLAIVKVSLYDLAALESIYRVLSLVALGLLLLVGAFAYQRTRPAEDAR